MEKEDFITIKIFIFKELLTKVNFRKLVKYFIPMEIDIKDMCKIKNLMDLESFNVLMAKNNKEISKMVLSKVQGKELYLTE